MSEPPAPQAVPGGSASPQSPPPFGPLHIDAQPGPRVQVAGSPDDDNDDDDGDDDDSSAGNGPGAPAAAAAAPDAYASVPSSAASDASSSAHGPEAEADTVRLLQTGGKRQAFPEKGDCREGAAWLRGGNQMRRRSSAGASVSSRLVERSGSGRSVVGQGRRRSSAGFVPLAAEHRPAPLLQRRDAPSRQNLQRPWAASSARLALGSSVALPPAMIPKANAPLGSAAAAAAPPGDKQAAKKSTLELTAGPRPFMSEIPLQSRAVRTARVQAKCLSRTTAHVSEFIRIKVVLTPGRSFPVTVQYGRDIEHLARLIEAEHAFRYNTVGRRGSNAAGAPYYKRRSSVVSDVADIAEDPYEPLEVCLLYDVGTVPLKFREKIGDVLNMDDVVNVLNAADVRSQGGQVCPQVPAGQFSYQVHHGDRRTSQLLEPVRDGEPLRTDGGGGDSGAAGAGDGEEPDANAGPARRPQPPHDPCLAVLRNLVGLEIFQEFCTRDFSVENLLLWLDVEMFTSLKDPATFLTHARYIYLTYLAESAPLQVNLREDVIRDVPWPLQSGWLVDRAMFDEVQDCVYAILKGHSFVRFFKSNMYRELLAIQNDERYADGQMRGPISDYFEPNLEVMQSAVEMADNSTKWVSQSFAKAPGGVKEQFLKRAMNLFFPRSRPVEGYFEDSNRLTTAQKLTTIQKEKKLAKFFGAKPSSELLAGQHLHGTGPQGEPLPGDGLFGLPDAGVVTPVSATAEESDLWSKKKRMEKLEGFFGDRLGTNQLADQKLYTPYDSAACAGQPQPPPPPPPPPTQTRLGGAVSTILRRASDTSMSSADEPAGAMNANDLSADERRVLAKRSKKLRGILGEPLRESVVATAITMLAKTAQSAEDLTSSSIAESDAGVPSAAREDGGPSAGAAEAEREAGSGGGGVLADSPVSPGGPLSAGLPGGEAAAAGPFGGGPTVARDSKEYRRKKLEKLVAFLGEQVPEESLLGWPVVSASYPPSQQQQQLQQQPGPADRSPRESRFKQAMSPTTKKVILKRSNKLERMLGQRLPPELLAKSDTSQLARESIASLTSIVQDPDSLLELMGCMTDFDAGGDGAGGGAGAGPPFGEGGGAGGDPAAVRMARIRKLKKLQRFFGSNFDPVAHVEAVILDDLEKSIDDEISSGKDLRDLKQQVGQLRQELRKAGSSLSFPEIGEEAEAHRHHHHDHAAGRQALLAPSPSDEYAAPPPPTPPWATPRSQRRASTSLRPLGSSPLRPPAVAAREGPAASAP